MCNGVIIILQRMTIVWRQRSIRRKVCPRDQSLFLSRKSSIYSASITGSDSQIGAKSVTPMPISFDALREDPVPLRGCVLWNRRAFMVGIMARAKDERAGRVRSLPSTFPTRNNVRLLKNQPSPGRARLCRESFNFRHVPQSSSHGCSRIHGMRAR